MANHIPFLSSLSIPKPKIKRKQIFWKVLVGRRTHIRDYYKYESWLPIRDMASTKQSAVK